MDRVEVIGMSIFGLLVVGGLVLGIRQGARQREQVASYSASRGYPVLAGGDRRLTELLAEASPTLVWNTHTVMEVGREAPRSFLFKYQSHPREGRSKGSNGVGFLAEHEGQAVAAPVEIFIRIPGLDAMVGDRVEAGSQEFRRHYSVASASGRSATELLNADIERILIGHREGPGWVLTVDISARAVLVTTFWAQTDEEWDYLVELGSKLRDAIR
jgi:hypothetical protein